MAKRKKKRGLGDEGYLLDQSYGRQDWSDDPFDNKYRGMDPDPFGRYRGMEPDPFGLMDDPFRGYGAPDTTHMSAVATWLGHAEDSMDDLNKSLAARDCPTAFYHLQQASNNATAARAHAVSIQDSKAQYRHMEEAARLNIDISGSAKQFVDKCLKTKSRK